MLITMDDQNLTTTAQLEKFLTAVEGTVVFSRDKKGYENKQKMYDWVADRLTRLRYYRLTKKEKGIVLKFLKEMTGLSHSRLKGLAWQRRRYGRLRVVTEGRHSFPRFYEKTDIALLATTDNAHGRISGEATKRILEREYRVFGKESYERLHNISVSHLYNIRGSNLQYGAATLFVQKTRAVERAIGIRKKPDNGGLPGFLRVDSVHQGDLDKEKGVYHINLVDEVTQWEIIMCVEGISEYFLEPALLAALDLFPFVIKNFHSDNGGEFVNQTVARLLNKIMAQQTKSRSRRTNDNALVEGKNASRVRKHMGHAHIQKKHAAAINAFYRSHMDEYNNYHRPCAFATDYTNEKGKVKKKYDTYLTPFEKLHSLPQWETYLKSGVTAAQLLAQSMEISDNESAQKLQDAKSKLFTSFRTC